MNFEALLNQYWGYTSFRGIQREIIESIAAGNDTLGLMPTGGGKSICFQVPAMAMEGTCVVITPLVALMKDQVGRLRQLGIKATTVHSGMKHADIVAQLENCILGDYKFLYLSPERLESELFIAKLRQMKVSMICVDEAHCISQWGYDFRPSYMRVSILRKLLPDVPILALTATATPAVVKDIQDKLGFRQGSQVFRMSFERKNLYYAVEKVENLIDGIRQQLEKHQGCTIIYTTMRQKAEETSMVLSQMGYSVTYFHAGLPELEKDFRQRDWQEGHTRIMVATNAFGMGIDKADVRLVLHIDPPDSLEQYYQEAGRAGRDGEPAWAIMLTDGKEQKRIDTRLRHAFPPKERVSELYDHICYYLQIAIGCGKDKTREFNLREFCINFRHSFSDVHPMLELLQLAGYIEFTDEEETASRLWITSTRQQLYKSIHADSEMLFNYLLRRYTGIFQEHVFIDEENISLATGLKVDEIYQKLRSLSMIHVISYIPRKSIPYITLKTQRIEGKDIWLGPTIYEERRERLVARLEGISRYISEQNKCRTAMLLGYFGEEYNHPCCNCDNCARKQQRKVSKSTLQAIEEEIVSQLSKGSLYGYQLNLNGYEQKDIETVLRQMTVRGLLKQDGLKLSLT